MLATCGRGAMAVDRERYLHGGQPRGGVSCKYGDECKETFSLRLRFSIAAAQSLRA